MSSGDVLITGATGFVGSHVVEAFRAEGRSVRALVRPSSRVDHLGELGIPVEVVPLEDPTGLQHAVQGAEVVVHLAALTHARTPDELERVNAGGTERLLDAVLRASPRPRRFVYMSSLAAVGPSQHPVRRQETPKPLTAYGLSKLRGEMVVLAASPELETVVLRAPAVYGPRDREMLRFFKLARRGVLPVPAGPPRPLQLVYVADLAAAVVAAATAERARGIYHIAEPRSYAWADVCRMLGRVAGRNVVLLPVPEGALAAAAAVSEWSAGLARRSTMFNRDKAKELLAPGWLCDTEDARKELGFVAATSLAEGLQRTWDWYRNESWL